METDITIFLFLLHGVHDFTMNRAGEENNYIDYPN